MKEDGGDNPVTERQRVEMRKIGSERMRGRDKQREIETSKGGRGSSYQPCPLPVSPGL